MLTEWRYSMKLNLGNQIRINRRRMNLTQEQLAEKFGTSPQAISRWEIGATYPDIEILPMIASFFETSVDALLGVTEEEKENMPKVTLALIKRIMSYLTPYWAKFLLVFATILVSSVLGLLPSIITGRIVDEALVGKDMALLIKLLLPLME